MGQRIEGLGFLVGAAPAQRGPGDLRPALVREWQRCLRPAAAVGLVTLISAGIGVFVAPPDASWSCALFAVCGSVASAGLARLLSRRRLLPAYRVMAEVARGLEQRWRAIDGGGIPETAAEGIARVGDRTDDPAVSMRLWCLLWGWDHLDEARDLIAAWQPSDPASLAYRDRTAVMVAPVRGMLNRGDAEQAIARITEPDDALRARVSLAVGLALDEEAAGRDPFPPLLAIADELPKAPVGEIRPRPANR